MAGDFNGDGFDDIAVGAPDENVGAVADAGVVHVLHGSAAGLTGTGSQYWSQAVAGILDGVEVGDRFGASLAAGDVDGGGHADLVAGAPGESVGAVADAGVVHVLLGTGAGLASAGNQLWGQNSAGISDSAEAGDGFGSAVAAGDFTDDGRTDLAIGAPGEDVGTAGDGGVRARAAGQRERGHGDRQPVLEPEQRRRHRRRRGGRWLRGDARHGRLQRRRVAPISRRAHPPRTQERWRTQAR